MENQPNHGSSSSSAGGIGKRSHSKNKFRPGGSAVQKGGNQQQQQQQQRRKGSGGAAGGKQKPERYVVIITNVENDFARVHEDNVASYCCLDPRRNRAHLKPAHTNPDAEAEVESVAEEEGAVPVCTYDIKCRSETRSAELRVYGKASASVASIFAPVPTKRVAGAVQGSSSLSSAAAGAKDAGAKEQQQEEDVTAALPITESTSTATAAAAGGTGVFTTLADMVMVLQHKPYFTHVPKFGVHLPGREAGDALQTTRGAKRKRVSTASAAAAAAKRPRSEKDGEEEDHQRHSSKSEEGGDAHAAADVLQQYAGHQADLVTAVAAVSTHWPVKELRRRLSDLPGFHTCWGLYKKHFRVVFQNSALLFEAKQLLDQFELDGNVRVTLTLSDTLSRGYADFLAARDDTGASPIAE